MNFRLLNKDEIDVRIGNKIGEKGYSLLLYKDARCDMNILDEADVVWQREHYECKGNLFCKVGIWDENICEWVWKSDCGTESNTEKEKGEASDSFKRACFNWGIGRELYTAPKIIIWKQLTDTEKYRSFGVADIGYEDRKISKLTIVDNKTGEVVFTYNPKQDEEELKQTIEENQKTQQEELDKFKEENKSNELTCEKCGAKITEKVANWSKEKYKKCLCYNCQNDFKNKSFGG